jgi:hypothetical protein
MQLSEEMPVRSDENFMNKQKGRKDEVCMCVCMLYMYLSEEMPVRSDEN